jgi:stage II sporulation protein D
MAYTASGARVKKLAVTGVGTDGKPLQIEISNADNVRIALGLKSALFTLKKEYDKDKNLTGVNISGSGWGHGLGMSQWGANGMAKLGYKYQDILKYYYSEIKIAPNYGR